MKIGIIKGEEPKSKIAIRPATMLKIMGIMAVTGAALVAAVMTKNDAAGTKAGTENE